MEDDNENLVEHLTSEKHLFGLFVTICVIVGIIGLCCVGICWGKNRRRPVSRQPSCTTRLISYTESTDGDSDLLYPWQAIHSFNRMTGEDSVIDINDKYVEEPVDVTTPNGDVFKVMNGHLPYSEISASGPYELKRI